MNSDTIYHIGNGPAQKQEMEGKKQNIDKANA
jgi:hypothetical protein